MVRVLYLTWETLLHPRMTPISVVGRTSPRYCDISSYTLLPAEPAAMNGPQTRETPHNRTRRCTLLEAWIEGKLECIFGAADLLARIAMDEDLGSSERRPLR